MFTATITSKNFNEGVMQVLVSFSDGAQTISKAFNVSSESNLKNDVKAEINRLNELKAFSQALPLGGYASLEPTPNVTPQAELDRQIWFRNFNRLEQLTKLNNLGALRPVLLPDLEALRTTVATDFKKAYIADM